MDIGQNKLKLGIKELSEKVSDAESEEQEKKEDKDKEQPEEKVDVFGFVAMRMRRGDDKEKITAELIQKGMEQRKAAREVDEAFRRIIKIVQKEQLTAGAVQTGVLGGIAAALVGGIGWAMLVINSEWELGMVVWGLGFLAGYAVVLSAGGKKGLPLQFVSSVSAILAVMTGKYIIFYHDLMESTGQTFKLEESFSAEMLQRFFQSLPELAGTLNMFWIFLAVASAWKIPKGLDIDLPPQYKPPYVPG